MPRKTDVVRCEIIYEEKDSRGFFRGETQVNQRNGIGVLCFKDGVVYHGQFAQDVPNGLAVETYPDGFVYKGEFVDDERHGFGMMQCQGLAYIGNWRNGKRHGPGVERLILKGETVESLADYDHGDFVGRQRIDIENREDVAELKRACGNRARKAALIAEQARVVSSAITKLREDQTLQEFALGDTPAASPSDKAVDPPPGSLYADTSAGETPTGVSFDLRVQD